MRKFTIRDLTLAALIAAVYAVLTVALPIPQYSGVQLRVAEAMTVLPFLFPAATPGLFVGCIIANLFSPYPLDILCGSAATLIACLMTQRMPNRWLAPLPPVLWAWGSLLPAFCWGSCCWKPCPGCALCGLTCRRAGGHMSIQTAVSERFKTQAQGLGPGLVPYLSSSSLFSSAIKVLISLNWR